MQFVLNDTPNSSKKAVKKGKFAENLAFFEKYDFRSG